MVIIKQILNVKLTVLASILYALYPGWSTGIVLFLLASAEILVGLALYYLDLRAKLDRAVEIEARLTRLETTISQIDLMREGGL